MNQKITICGNTVFIDDKCIRTPTTRYPHNITQVAVNGKESVFVDGYELKNGEWKITLRSIWHYIF